tara:strand:+ start:14041 stop:15315 length:1275 start_codon:yes stop_codon:yes gene_type:complete
MVDKQRLKEDLRKWFGTGGKGGVGGGGWDRYNTKGERIGKCARGPGEGKPKCLSKEKAAKLRAQGGKKKIAKAVRRKRRKDPVADRSGKGGSPVMVSNKIETKENTMRKIVELPLSEIKEGCTILKDHGFSYTVESIEKISTNVRLMVLSDSKGNEVLEYATLDKNYNVREEQLNEKSPAWSRKEGKNKEGGLNAAGRKSYERENPGSDLKAPVSREQAAKSKGGKAAKRRKSFCARMGGMPGPMKDEKGRPTRKALSLRKWDCGSLNSSYEPEGEEISEGKLYDRLVSQLLARGMPTDKAHATATMQLQKSGSFKSGTKELTKHGKKRQSMGASGRAKDRAAKRSGKNPSDYKYNPKTNGATLKSHFEPEGTELTEKNVPTNPSLWSKAKSLAKSKFDVYPSAYANGWASKWYKKRGGGWKKG